jgi:hypothetical protein
MPRALSAAVLASIATLLPAVATADHQRLVVRRFLADKPLCRAARPTVLTAAIVNDGSIDADFTATLTLPPGMRLVEDVPANQSTITPHDGERLLQFQVETENAGPAEIVLELSCAGMATVRESLVIDFLPPYEPQQLDAVPPPQPATTDLLVGAIHCPLWEADRIDLWRGVLRHGERLPALGLYSQENPQVADWEAKWALEHGISFFVYCWYRDGQGGAVRTRFGRGLHDGFFKSRCSQAMKFALMWENQARGHGGVSDERDLLDNLMPYWIDTYFKHPGYLKLDDKPVLFVYDLDGLIRDLGGLEKAVQTVEAMRAACRDAGFSGLTLLGEYRGFDPSTLDRMRAVGFDASFAYCWHIAGSPSPDEAAARQLDAIKNVRDRGVLPQVVTVSQGWSGWHDEGTVWSIPPARFERLLRDTKEIIAALPKDQLGSRMMLLDNWNEWGEGHFIAPSRQHGFGYLDAVRSVFATAPGEHIDLLPEDLGLGPYDSAARAALAHRDRLRPLLTRRLSSEAPPPDLVGWWKFDEPPDTPVAFDASGHRLGGELLDVGRSTGIVGNAIDCAGGVVVVPDDPLLSVHAAFSVDCWVKTNSMGQHDRWIVNRVLGGGESTGFRLGVIEGKPAFEVPQTAWSHLLTAAEPLPPGRWVHLAGTFDGRAMRLFVDGLEVAVLDRPGPVNPSHFDLMIGGFEPGSRAYFEGSIDEVRLFARALTAEEIRQYRDTIVQHSKAAIATP